MTREEAIECLSERVSIGKTCEQSCMVGFGVNFDTLDEALDMAISALRQQETVTDSHKMTNANRIRAMSDEELVNLHYSSSAHCIASDPTVCDRHDFVGNLTPCEQCYLKWLQQPAEEADHD